MNTVDSLRDCIDDVLGVRDCIGADLKEVKLCTRTWSGKEPGEGEVTELIVDIVPSPKISDYSHAFKVLEGGALQQGDLLLRGISKNRYPLAEDVNCVSPARNVERFYEVDGKLYRVISITEKHLWWNVQVRKATDQRRG